MRWRGIKSQSQLARISGVPQSCIHHILTRQDGYWPSRRTLLRLARALGTTAPWLTDGVAAAPAEPPPERTGASEPGGYCAEICALVSRQPHSAQRQILAAVRLMTRP